MKGHITLGIHTRKSLLVKEIPCVVSHFLNVLIECWLFKQTKNMYFPPFSKLTDSASVTLADAPQPDPGWCNEGIQDCNGPHTKQHCKKLCESQPGKRLTKMLYHI